MVSSGFVIGLGLLLFTPGPTNTLLALAGATAGAGRALPLLAAEVLAYLVTVSILGGVIALVGAEMDALRPWMQAAAAAYLMMAAFRMWRRPPDPAAAGPVGPGLVGLTTLLNPKTLIIAFVLMPAGWSLEGAVAAAHLATMAVMIPLAGFAWFRGGRLLAAATGASVRALIPRASALLLGLFAMALAGRALAGG